ncbi:MerR family transcriptional regulator [Arabiibacter massiliensis]|uniref:MerR family transcriptional regulator n=1 Tax=Arabiibacter massiliensis TaxID=1870985 RepID=UPI0009BB27EF|nr:MerR family transcriptional regulator [Arabiibacter massiliensis]
MGAARHYDIKDAARFLRIAPSTLRYWESQGLVRAGRGEQNGYRRYSLHDLIEASEIAFYRKLGVPVRELEGYRALSARGLDEALARTEDDVERRIAELEATRARLARQRTLNVRLEELERAGMRPSAPALESLSAIDYATPAPWKLLVEEPWNYGVLIRADAPGTVLEAVADARAGAGEALWRRSPSDDASTCRECLLKVSPTASESNAAELFAEAARQGVEPEAVVGSYLLTATDDAGRWDYHRAWVVGARQKE